jgi:hypothetical protein
MAVYEAHQRPSGNYLWRVMGRDGLQSGETPLVTQFQRDSRACKSASKLAPRTIHFASASDHDSQHRFLLHYQCE